MSEHRFWLSHPAFSGQELYAALHVPEAETVEARGVVVLCHAFAEEKKCAQRVWVTLARRLCDEGFFVLRFDHRGCGDSAGRFDEFTIADWLNDLHATIEYAKSVTNFDMVSLIGLRLGGSLCAIVAAQRQDIDALVLWQPVVSGERYAKLNLTRTKMRTQLITQEGRFAAQTSQTQNPETQTPYPKPADLFADFDGYPITQRLYDDLSSLDLMRSFPRPHRGVLLMQISGSCQMSGELKQLASHYGKAGVVCEAMPIREQPFWNFLGLVEPEELIQQTVQWLKTHVIAPATPVTSEQGYEDAKIMRCRDKGMKAEAYLMESAHGERLVTFTVNGESIHAVLNLPARGNVQPGKEPETRNVFGLIFLHGWSGYRAGPHQMFVKLSRRLAARGIPCLRLDFRGRGESDGDLRQASLLTMIEDTNAAMDYLEQNMGIEGFVLLGICSGGEVAFGAASDKRVAGLLLWSAPIFAGLEDTRRTARKRWHHLKQYGRKLLRKETWRKLVRLQLQPKTIWKVLTSKADESLTPRTPRTKPAPKRGELALEAPIQGEAAQVQEWQKQKLRDTLELVRQSAKVNVLMVYGTNDADTPLATRWYRQFMESKGVVPQLHLVQGANHSYYSLRWESEVFDVTQAWLERQFA